MRTSNLDSGQCQIERGFLSDELASCSSSTPPCKNKKQWLLTWTVNIHCLLPWSYCTAVQSPKAVAAYLKSEQTLSFGFALQCSMTIHERYSVPYIFYYWISGHLKTLTRATPISGVSLWSVLLCKLHLCPPFTDQSLQPGCRRFLRVLVMPGKYWAWGGTRGERLTHLENPHNPRTPVHWSSPAGITSAEPPTKCSSNEFSATQLPARFLGFLFGRIAAAQSPEAKHPPSRRTPNEISNTCRGAHIFQDFSGKVGWLFSEVCSSCSSIRRWRNAGPASATPGRRYATPPSSAPAGEDIMTTDLRHHPNPKQPRLWSLAENEIRGLANINTALRGCRFASERRPDWVMLPATHSQSPRSFSYKIGNLVVAFWARPGPAGDLLGLWQISPLPSPDRHVWSTKHWDLIVHLNGLARSEGQS